MFSQHFTNPMDLSTPCFNTNRFKRQTAFRLVATRLRLGLNITKIAKIQTATHMDLMWNYVVCRSGLKFVYSEKATKFFEIFPLLLSTVHTDKSKAEISQNFVAFSEYTNFNHF